MTKLPPSTDDGASDADTFLSEEVKAGEEAIRDDYVQWTTLGEGCRMKKRHRGAQ